MWCCCRPTPWIHWQKPAQHQPWTRARRWHGALIGVAVRKGEPHPDISTPAKFRAVMLAAKMVSQTAPGPPRFSMEASVIDRILHRPDMAGVR